MATREWRNYEINFHWIPLADQGNNLVESSSIVSLAPLQIVNKGYKEYHFNLAKERSDP